MIFTKAFYEQYLKSKQWELKRKYIYDLRKGICDFCHKPVGKRYDVHHKNYDRFTFELDSDLMLVHERCHRILHWKLQRNRVNGKSKIK